MTIRAIDHVQLAMPPGRESEAIAFYSGVLGFDNIEKPGPMRASGGCWFRAGRADLHLGTETEFHPARKAHPALRVSDLDGLAERCGEAGVPVEWDDRYPGFRRFYVQDPFGNRIEFLQPDIVSRATTADLTLRRADAGDLDRVLALLAELHPADAPPSDPAPIWQQILQSDTVRIIVAERASELVGCLTLVVVPNLTRGGRAWALVENVVTRAAERGLGVGTALLRQAQADAYAEGCYKVMLLTGSSTPETIRCYQAAGFTRDIKEGFVAYPDRSARDGEGGS